VDKEVVKNKPIEENFKNKLEDYAISLDIKDKVIAQLRNEIDSVSVNLQSIPIISAIGIQIYWAFNDMIFTEGNSSSQLVNLNETTTVSFKLPVEDNIYFLRFDLGNSIGFLNIHSIEIKNDTGELIWVWNKETVNFKNGAILIKDHINFNKEIIQLSTTKDPQIVLQVNSENDVRNFINSTVEITLSRLNTEQSDFISNYLSTPLSFGAEKENHSLRNVINELTIEKSTLLNEISSVTAQFNNLHNEKLSIENKFKNSEAVTQQLLTDKTNSQKENAFLSNELVLKNEIISNFFNEKKTLESKVIEKEKSLTKISLALNSLEKEKEKISNELNQANGYSNQLAEKIEYSQKKWDTEKKNLLQNIELLDIQVKEVKAFNVAFSSELSLKNDTIKKAATEIEKLQQLFIKKEEELKSITLSVRNLEKEKESLSIDLVESKNLSSQLSDKILYSEKVMNEEKALFAKNMEALSTLNQELRGINSLLLTEIDLKNKTKDKALLEIDKALLEKDSIQKRNIELSGNLLNLQKENQKLLTDIKQTQNDLKFQTARAIDLQELLNNEKQFYATNRNAYDQQLLSLIENESILLAEKKSLKADSDYLKNNYEHRTLVQVIKFRISRKFNRMKKSS